MLKIKTNLLKMKLMQNFDSFNIDVKSDPLIAVPKEGDKVQIIDWRVIPDSFEAHRLSLLPSLTVREVFRVPIGTKGNYKWMYEILVEETEYFIPPATYKIIPPIIPKSALKSGRYYVGKKQRGMPVGLWDGRKDCFICISVPTFGMYSTYEMKHKEDAPAGFVCFEPVKEIEYGFLKH